MLVLDGAGGLSGTTLRIAFISPKLWCRKFFVPFAPGPGPAPPAGGTGGLPIPTPIPSPLSSTAMTLASTRSCSRSQFSIGRVHVHSLHALSRIRYICDVDDDGTGEPRPFHVLA